MGIPINQPVSNQFVDCNIYIIMKWDGGCFSLLILAATRVFETNHHPVTVTNEGLGWDSLLKMEYSWWWLASWVGGSSNLSPFHVSQWMEDIPVLGWQFEIAFLKSLPYNQRTRGLIINQAFTCLCIYLKNFAPTCIIAPKKTWRAHLHSC